MSIERIPKFEEFIDIVVEDHKITTVFVLIVIAGLLGICFYYYFWPIISEQPEYTDINLFHTSDTLYNVTVTMPKISLVNVCKIDSLSLLIEQKSVCKDTQKITLSLLSSSPFLNFVNINNDSTKFYKLEKLIKFAPIKFGQQSAKTNFYFIFSDTTDSLQDLPIEICLSYKNRISVEKVYFELINSDTIEYTTKKLFQPDVRYNVIAVVPKRLEPDEEKKYNLSFIISQESAFVTDKQTLKLILTSLSPFLRIITNNGKIRLVDSTSIEVAPTTPKPQQFESSFNIKVSRSAEKPPELPG